ncbi:MAG: DUF3375 domain-containing protein, partial [Methanobacterium sp.]|nr:DUF3375 domain-containing protein [Methanobacterium sp.]
PPTIRTFPHAELVSRLEDFLYHLRQGDEDAYPRTAAHYLDDWAADERGWLRKYYPAGSDEPFYDLSAATEKTIEWIAGLGQRQFVGAEARLLTVFELLRQMAEGTELDPAVRLADLARRKADLDAEIARIRGGRLDLMDATQVRDRFLQMAATARGLLSDFREVDQNFRDLDRSLRERIAGWDEGKGALLAQMFGERDAIAESDQGKSFRAFWDFLMAPARQDELSGLLDAVFKLAPVRDLEPDRRLLRIHYDWLEAGEVTQRTVARLSEQLRRYLDDKARLEDRRIMTLIREVETRALAVRDAPPDGPFMELDEGGPDVALPFDRRLFTPPFKPVVADLIVTVGDQDIPADALFEQVYVDKARLAGHIRRALQVGKQVSLADLVASHPLELGWAEVIAYMGLAAEDRDAVIDDSNSQTLIWTDVAGDVRCATVPLVIFGRRAT